MAISFEGGKKPSFKIDQHRDISIDTIHKMMNPSKMNKKGSHTSTIQNLQPLSYKLITLNQFIKTVITSLFSYLQRQLKIIQLPAIITMPNNSMKFAQNNIKKITPV